MPKVDISKLVTTDEKAVQALAAERAGMRAYRLAFEDVCAATPYGDGTLLDATDALLAGLPARQARRYGNITIFERLRPEVPAFLQNPDAINLTDAQIDDLFRLAMRIEAEQA